MKTLDRVHVVLEHQTTSMDPYESGKSSEVRQEFSPILVPLHRDWSVPGSKHPDFQWCLYQTLRRTKIDGYKCEEQVGLIVRWSEETQRIGRIAFTIESRVQARHMATMARNDGSDSFR